MAMKGKTLRKVFEFQLSAEVVTHCCEKLVSEAYLDKNLNLLANYRTSEDLADWLGKSHL